MKEALMRTAALAPYSEKWDETETKPLTMDELIRSNRELEQFAFAASHDLQEPLKVVSLYLQLLKKKYKRGLIDRAEHDISLILDRTDRLQDLIQSMLNYAQVRKGNLSLVQLDSGVALHRAIENLKASIDKNSAQITYGSCPVIMGDAIQLTQLFQNLINNAIKFHKENEPPCVHIYAALKADHWLFSIQDNGIGVEWKHLQNIFDMFTRLHPQSEYEGSGIGLSLCKRIVKCHGGRIWAESEIEKGTTVYFTMPKM
jgi:light-regulated signal transduction histidine kinase (bacteriophytochrome)